MLRRVWRGLYRRLVADRVSGEARIVYFLRAAGVTPGSRVLDVGCGQGVVLLRLRDELGVDAEGVEVNPETAAGVRRLGFVCHAPEEAELDRTTWQALVMSHVIEHLSYEPLTAFLERYLTLLEIGGVLVIATPFMHPRFYDDCDHVRPYPPEALDQLFGRRGQQVRQQVSAQLELVELWFRRSPVELRPTAHALLGCGGVAEAAMAVVNGVLLAVFHLSLQTVGRRTGWVGLYRRVA